jgi:DNA-binding XRE family transcriptional regulator
VDNEREPEISEETLRLVRELGARLEKDAGDLQFRTVTDDLSDATPHYRLQAQIDSLRRELAEVEQQLRRLEQLGQRPDLEERAWRLHDGLRHLQRDAEIWLDRPAMEMRLNRYGPGALPEYLQKLESDIMMGSPGAYWLHGEDARERGRAGDTLTMLLTAGANHSWVTAVIDLSNKPVRRRDRPGSELEFAVRRAWDAWDEDPGARPATGILRGPAFRTASRGSSGVAIILPEFPARHKKAAPMLKWLSSGMAMGSVPLLVIVSTESPPEAPVGAGFQTVLCETAAARTGRRIAELRLQKGWNRAELAARAEIPQSTLAQVEGGLRSAGGALLKRVAQALGTDPNDLRRA